MCIVCGMIIIPHKCFTISVVTTPEPAGEFSTQSIENECTDEAARRRGLTFTNSMLSTPVLPGDPIMLRCVTPDYTVRPTRNGHVTPAGEPLISVCVNPDGSRAYFIFEDEFPKDELICQGPATPDELRTPCE